MSIVDEWVSGRRRQARSTAHAQPEQALSDAGTGTQVIFISRPLIAGESVAAAVSGLTLSQPVSQKATTGIAYLVGS